LIDTTEYPYIDPAAAQAITARRGELSDLLRRKGPPLQLDDGAARWWTFAGGRINHTLKYGLEWSQGWKVVADNFQLRIEGNGVTHETVEEAIRTVAKNEFWHASETREALLSRLPPYRLSKFQGSLSEDLSLETVGRYLLDIDGT